MRRNVSSRAYSAYKRKRKRNAFIRAACIVVVIFAIVLSLGLCSKSKLNSGDKDKINPQVTEVSSSVVYTTVTSVSDSKDASETLLEQITEPASEEIKENSAEFEEIIGRAGYSADDFDFSQLITVDATGSYATVNAFEKVDGTWVKTQVLSGVSGCVGSQGVSESASEYASYTPKGLYPLGTGFGICDDPGTGLDYIKVTEDSYWVDDVNSKYYNQYVDGTEDKDWSSAEHLIEYSGAYDYCVFIEYNTNPVIPGDGSAFFLHVGTTPTAGCVAIPEEDMQETLVWLNKWESPHILIF